jgi:hypothetical protein
MQNDFDGTTLAAELLKLLDPAHNAATRAQLADATHGLGAGGASVRAAQAILRALRVWSGATSESKTRETERR